MDENTPTTEPGGLNRRDMLRRSALVGGALIWTAPAVQTLAAPAFAAGSTTPGDQCDGHSGSISYVVALIKCGNSYYLVKYSATGEGAMACGDSVSVSSDDNFCTTGLNALKTKAGTALLGTCPPGVSGGTNCSTTNQLACDLEIVLPVGCSLEGYVLHDGRHPDAAVTTTRASTTTAAVSRRTVATPPGSRSRTSRRPARSASTSD